MYKGAKLAVKEVNAAGGVGGKQIELTAEDGKCNGKDASSAAQKLISSDKVKYIIGGGCSGETFAIIPIAEAAKVFVISPSASAPTLSGISPYFVRNNPNDNIPAVGLAEYVAKHYKTVAVISENTDYAQAFKNAFSGEVEKRGVRVVAKEDYETTSTDFRTVISKAKSANPEVIFINPQTGGNTARIATQLRGLGIKTPLVSAAFTGPEVLAAGSAVEGMVLAVPPGLSGEGKGAQFTAAFKAEYGSDSAYPFYAGAGYDAVYLIKQAVESVGDDGTKVAAYMHELPSYTGTLGTYHFDQNGDLAGISSIMQRITGGKVIDYKE